jgi:6-phosphogluconate dehydrogenase
VQSIKPPRAIILMVPADPFVAAPIPAIEAAVMARNRSSRLEERREGEALFGAPQQALHKGAPGVDALEQALIVGKVLCHARASHCWLLRHGNLAGRCDCPKLQRSGARGASSARRC